MKAVVQRVKKASVAINGSKVAEISKGLLLLLSVADTDTKETIKWFANKIANLRICEDSDGKMNLSILDTNGELLIVSNFTIYGNAQKGFRPSFAAAASPEIAEPIYNQFVDYCRIHYPINIQTGEFGAMMDVELINDGPVTIIIEK